MTRADDDTWDIATSVGTTAVAVAMARADETSSANPLIRDQFAEPLVTTPQLAEVRAQVSSWWTDTDAGEAGQNAVVTAQQLTDYLAVRTHYFDAFFTAAAQAGIGQHVILAAGLDSRAYRMDWPADTVIYEIDLPAVLEYKATTLKAHGARPATTRREVGVDLRQDWPAALREAGFDRTQATAWLAEGLLPFLPGHAQEALFTNIDQLSAADSRVAVEVIFGDDNERRREFEDQQQKLRAAREQRGEDVSFDPSQLLYGDEGRPDCAEWFDSHGWKTQSIDVRQESARLGRMLPTSDREPSLLIDNSFVTAELPVRL